MGLILWIDNNYFAASLVEKVYKKRGLAFYRLESPKDFSYLVDDLKPALIVIDQATILAELEVFKQQYQSSLSMQETRFVVLGSWEGLDFIKHRAGSLERKLEPFELPDQLAKIATIN